MIQVGVGLGADRLPDLLLKILGHRAADGSGQNEAEHLGLDRRVGELGARRYRAFVERGHRRDAAALDADGTCRPRASRRHRPPVYSSTNRTPEDIWSRWRSDVRPYSVPASPGHVRRGEIVDRADAPLGDRDPDQHRRDRLGHRPRREPIAVGPRVLVALDEDRLVAGDQEPGRRVARQIVVEAEGLPLVLVAQRGLGRGPRERRRFRGPMDRCAREDLVLVALRADQERDAEEGRAVAERIALAGAVLVGIRSTRVEGRDLAAAAPTAVWRTRPGRSRARRRRPTPKIHSRRSRSRAARPRGTRSPRARRGESRRARAPTVGRSPRPRRS